MRRSVIVDSDAIFALYNPNDALNEQATFLFEKLVSQDYDLIYPSSVIFEIISLFQRVLPTPKVTAELIELLKNDQLIIQIVDAEILKEAASIFDPSGSRKNTLVDCSVAAIAKILRVEAIFSYDSFYTKQGYKLAKDLF